MWEPLHWALNVLGDLPLEDQIAAAERAMRELFAEELIFFVDEGDWHGQAWQDRILSRAEVDAAIGSSAWRSVPLVDDVTIWFAGTEAGKAVVLQHWATLRANKSKSNLGPA